VTDRQTASQPAIILNTHVSFDSKYSASKRRAGKSFERLLVLYNGVIVFDCSSPRNDVFLSRPILISLNIHQLLAIG